MFKQNNKFNTQFLLLSLLLGLYISFFHVSNNMNLIRPQYAIYSILLITSSSIFVGSFLLFVTSFLKLNRNIAIGLLFVFVFYCLRSSIIGVFSKYFFDQFDMIRNIHNVLPGVFLLLGGFLLGLICSLNIKKTIIVTVIVIVFPVYETAGKYINYIASKSHLINYNYEEIQFKNKLNVYFVLFDSYSNVDFLERINFDFLNEYGSNFLELLEEKGFRTYNSFYSNYSATKNTMPSYFMMDYKYSGKLMANVEYDTRSKMIAGHSNVVNIFKDNGYRTNLIFQNDYLTEDHCYADFCVNSLDTRGGTSKLVRTLGLFNKVVLNSFMDLHIDPTAWFSLSVEDVISHIDPTKENQFTYLHLYIPGHSPTDSFCESELETKQYLDRVRDTNQYMSQIIEKIASVDDNAIIIVASDHGPRVTNKCMYGVSSLDPLHIMDRVGTFLAIKWGGVAGNYDGRYDTNIKSVANLFRYLFAYMAEDESILNAKVHDDSYIVDKNKIQQVIKDGNFVFIETER